MGSKHIGFNFEKLGSDHPWNCWAKDHYCWWLKSCTTWDIWNPKKNWDKLPTSTGARFQPSPVLRLILRRQAQQNMGVELCTVKVVCMLELWTYRRWCKREFTTYNTSLGLWNSIVFASKVGQNFCLPLLVKKSWDSRLRNTVTANESRVTKKKSVPVALAMSWLAFLFPNPSS